MVTRVALWSVFFEIQVKLNFDGGSITWYTPVWSQSSFPPFMRMLKAPPTRKSIFASLLVVSPGHIQSRMLSGSLQAANTSCREAGISLRSTSLSFVSSISSAMTPLFALLARYYVSF